MARAKNQELIDDLTLKMNESIKNYKRDPQQELELLKYIGQFPKYSIRNTALIQSQYEGAWGVASYKQFKEQGYQVQRGEKALRILAPKFQDMFKYEENGQTKRKPIAWATNKEKEQIKKGEYEILKDQLTGYVAVPVFDITQTDCPPEDYPKLYPNKPENFNFKGTDNDLDNFNKTITEYAENKKINVRYGVIDSAAKGYYRPFDNSIMISENLNKKEQTKVLLHELAHAEMHNSETMSEKSPELKSTNVKEYQAEMTAYIVSNKFELDSEDYSTKYLSNWTERKVDDEVYLQSLEEVKKVSANMITKIVEKYNEMERSQNHLLQTENTKEEIKSVPIETPKVKDSLSDIDVSNKTLIFRNKSKNDYPVQENQIIKATMINVEEKKGYIRNIVKLESENKNIYKSEIFTAETTKEDLEKWQSGMTGKEWLDTDLKSEICKAQPQKLYPITANDLNGMSDEKLELKDIQEEIKEREISKEKVQIKSPNL